LIDARAIIIIIIIIIIVEKSLHSDLVRLRCGNSDGFFRKREAMAQRILIANPLTVITRCFRSFSAVSTE